MIELSGQFEIVQSKVIMAILSVATFGISLYIAGERYHERADQFKSCYLKLQALYYSDIDTASKLSRYADILELYENQSDDDYDEMRYDSYWRGQILENANGVIKMLPSLIAFIALKRFARRTLYVTLFLAPIVLGVALVKKVAIVL